jgi:hypothetical protein
MIGALLLMLASAQVPPSPAELRVCDADIFYVLDPNEVVEIQRIHADELEIQLGHVEHVVDVVKSQDELICGPSLDVQLPARHLSHVKRVSWFFRDEKAFLSGQHIFMKSP